MNVRTLLAALLVSASFGCIEAAPEAQNSNANNVQNNNVQTNNGQTNNQTNNVLNNNVLNNNVLNNSNNLTNNTNQNNVREPWHNDTFSQRIRFDINLDDTGGGFVGNLQVLGLPEFDPMDVEFRDADDVIYHDYEADSGGSYWMRFDNAPAIWMYFASSDQFSDQPSVWGDTSMYHFGQSALGYNSNQSTIDLMCGDTECSTEPGIRGTSLSLSGGTMAVNTGGTHPANAENVTFLAWLNVSEFLAGEPIIMRTLDTSNDCGWELVATETALQLRVRSESMCVIVETLTVDYPDREVFLPLTVRIRRTQGAERVALRLGTEPEIGADVLVPEANLFQIGRSFAGEIDELQIIPAWVNDNIIETHVQNLLDEDAVLQNEVEYQQAAP